MGKKRGDLAGLPTGEQTVIERMSVGPVVADTFAGRIHVEWDNSATVAPRRGCPRFSGGDDLGGSKLGGLSVSLKSSGVIETIPVGNAADNVSDVRGGRGTPTGIQFGSQGPGPGFLTIGIVRVSRWKPHAQ
jgi:hypothetical protein